MYVMLAVLLTAEVRFLGEIMAAVYAYGCLELCSSVL